VIPFAILAGGLGTRLGSATATTPKALVTVAGRPFIDHQLTLLRGRGAERVVLCLGRLGEHIREHVGRGDRWGLRVDYSFDGPRLLGTGGALRGALALLDDRFGVLYGDTYLDCDYRAVDVAHRRSGQPGLMTVFRNENRWDRSNVVFRDGRIERYSKVDRTAAMTYIDWGLGVLCASALSSHGQQEAFDLEIVYQELARQNQLAGFEVQQRFYEIGSPEGLVETEAFLLRKELRASQDVAGQAG
jgi:MurNAc alpha-1-phosphate uridylyltransferase